MQNLTEWPPPLLRKWFLLALIGFGCFAVGVVMLIAVHDLILFYMSLILAGLTAGRCALLYRRIGRGEYETLEGVCVSTAWIPVQRRRKVCLLTEDGEERSMTVDGKKPPRIGGRYRAYFLTPGLMEAPDNNLNWLSRPQAFVMEELEGAAIEKTSEE